MVAPFVAEAQNLDVAILGEIHDRAERGDPAARFVLGVAYAMGEGVPLDVGRAIAWWRRLGEPDASRPASEKDEDDSHAFDVSLERRRGERGDVGAQMELAERYLVGKGVVRDDAAAVAWARRAAEQGHPHAYLLLGVMHLAGRAFPRDDVAAYKWLRLFVAQSTYLGCYSRLARAEHCDRFRLMRVQLDDELGAGLDAAQLAGVQESMEAQRRVVLEGRRHSAALVSLRMVREHANRGVASAQREVGRLYLAGGALPRDVVMAHMWLSLAVAAGDADASVLREQLATEMDAEELAEARRLAARWLPLRAR